MGAVIQVCPMQGASGVCAASGASMGRVPPLSSRQPMNSVPEIINNRAVFVIRMSLILFNSQTYRRRLQRLRTNQTDARNSGTNDTSQPLPRFAAPSTAQVQPEASVVP